MIDLWPGDPPETQATPTELVITERADPQHVRDRFAAGVTNPNLVVFPAAKPGGQAVLIIPGGGYRYVVMDKEGYEAAEWLQKRGVTAFVLMYRQPGDSWTNRSDVPLQDAQRSLRIVRSLAGEYGFNPGRVGVMGFSAGGHLAASLATGFDRDVYEPVDDVDAISARPDFAVLMYPVISMDASIAHMGSRQKLLGENPGDAAIARYSVELNVPAETPPVFLLHASDDEAVVVDNSLRLFDALRAAGVPTDLHVFSEGGHGFGLRYATDKPVAKWIEMTWRWMQALDP